MPKSLVALFAVVVLLAAVNAAHTQDDALQEGVRTFMRAKLEHSQRVLEGLTTEDFELIAKSSQELSLLSLAAQWQVIQTPEYARRSTDFRREVEALSTAAEKNSLDGATLAYLKVTMNCVECHKYVRSVRQVQGGEPVPEVRFAAVSFRQ